MKTKGTLFPCFVFRQICQSRLPKKNKDEVKKICESLENNSLVKKIGFNLELVSSASLTDEDYRFLQSVIQDYPKTNAALGVDNS